MASRRGPIRVLESAAGSGCPGLGRLWAAFAILDLLLLNALTLVTELIGKQVLLSGS